MDLWFPLMGADLKAIGGRIRAARKRAGLTQEQLAALVGVTGGAVSQWESGLTTPDLRPIIALCEASAANSADEILLGKRRAALGDFERQVLETFRQLPQEFQIAAHASLNQLWELSHPGKAGPANPFPNAPKTKA